MPQKLDKNLLFGVELHSVFVTWYRTYLVPFSLTHIFCLNTSAEPIL